jgi:hypothetical protein
MSGPFGVISVIEIPAHRTWLGQLRADSGTMAVMSRAAQHRYRLTTPGRRVMRAPKPDVVLGVIESLPRDGHVLLESMDEPEIYIQVG